MASPSSRPALGLSPTELTPQLPQPRGSAGGHRCPQSCLGEVPGKRLAPRQQRCSLLGSRALLGSWLQLRPGPSARGRGGSGIIKTRAVAYLSSLCLLPGGVLRECFWSLASEPVQCRVGNRSRRNWDGRACPGAAVFTRSRARHPRHVRNLHGCAGRGGGGGLHPSCRTCFPARQETAERSLPKPGEG